MHAIGKQILDATTIPETSDGSLSQIVDFLTQPDNVKKMIDFSELGLPALAAVVHELEKYFADSQFALNFDAPDKNAPHRRDIGWLIKAVMKRFGYAPVELKDEKGRPYQMRIGKYAKSRYFSTSAVYRRQEGVRPDYEINCEIVQTF